MGQTQSAPQHAAHSSNRGGGDRWVDAFKLAFITTAVAALQFVRYQLSDEPHSQDRNGRDRRHNRHHNKPLLELPVEVRRACIDLIDYHAMPLLVDQWRLKLVSVLLSPERGPIIEECSPSNRQSLLDTLTTYQRARRAANARTSQPRNPIPFQEATTSSSRPTEADARETAAAVAAAKRAEEMERERRERERARERLRNAPGPRAVAEPSAPPMPSSFPEAEEGWTQVAPSAPSTTSMAQPEECHICMEADVEVEVDSCHHGMCIECARAICSMTDRAAQCPFCRGPIMSMSPVTPGAKHPQQQHASGQAIRS
ncbi:hypothetical protein WJX73_010935 [Symbiochloris irregularis]|uniref:RING-type domain-containing protein n=1 Tax=Symbiochloris irregularis TaxID=706552 RepID=A0AAW1NXP0_9CHLO